MTAYLERSGRATPDGAQDESHSFGRAGRLLELVALADSLRGPLDAPRPPAGARNRSRRALLVRALEELEAGSLDGLTLRVLAERLEVSERQASRLLRDELGTSFPDYLAALRIERAKKLLATTDEPVTDVALETGWQSISHFNAVFRRRVGVTPTLYRAQHWGERSLQAVS
jgi:transcriptional regulator GlxA family with amidase domain